ncbi:MAG: AraC family transcriptional regulator [Gammaproteobacteria bacterium]|nr:AraC family transcriptional regulator [Gammaproteobacteria bacterium]
MLENVLAAPPELAPADTRQAELIDLVARFAPSDGRHYTAITPLQLIRASEPRQHLCSVYEPGLSLVVQGRKQVSLAGEVFPYDPQRFLIISVTLPVIGHVLEATPERPFLCARLDIDPREIRSLMLAAGVPERKDVATERGLHVALASDTLLDAVLRLLRLLSSPKDAPVLAPLALREIFYRVLMGDLGPVLRELAVADGQTQRIAHVIDLLKQRYAEPIRIDELAGRVHMSPSSLHHHFKAVTAMSPLQFQKQLRLHEARRLMLAEGLEAAVAGHRVGYESPSQFSREYRRLFGAPPRQEITQMRKGG